MNREQKRTFKKEIKKKLNKTSLSDKMKERVEQYITQDQGASDLFDGDKVKLNYNRIISYPDFKKMRPEYIEFIESNKETIFTAEKYKSLTVQLQEDTNNPKFLFWPGDLILVERNKNKSELENYMDEVNEKIKELESKI